MAFINNFGREIDTARSGQVLSDPAKTKTLYFTAYKGVPTLEKPASYWERLTILAGDPVLCIVDITNANPDEKAKNGKIVSYAGVWYSDYREGAPNAVVGIALADAKYKQKIDGAYTWYESDPIPVMVQGDVIVTIPALNILNRGAVGRGVRGHYYVGEYIDVNGLPSSDEKWDDTAAYQLIGQIMAPKTDGSTDDQAIETRLYRRSCELDNPSLSYYHIPVRLMISPVVGNSGSMSLTRSVNADNVGITVGQFAKVSLRYNTNTSRWEFEGGAIEGQLVNGVTAEIIQAGNPGQVYITGEVVFDFGLLQSMLRSSPAGRCSPAGQRLLAPNTANVKLSDIYRPGMRVTDSAVPIVSGMPGNQFGVITEVSDGEENNIDPPHIVVNMDPVATQAPTNVSDLVTIDTASIPPDTPGGTPLKRNPINGKLYICTSPCDNVDAYLENLTEIEEVNGWNIENYRAVYGAGVFEDNGKIWKAICSFGKGVWQRVIKPAVQWIVPHAPELLQVAGKVMDATGHPSVSKFFTNAGQLLEGISESELLPNANGKWEYRTVFGTTAYSDEPVVTRIVDGSNGGGDTQRNKTMVVQVKGGLEHPSFAIRYGKIATTDYVVVGYPKNYIVEWDYTGGTYYDGRMVCCVGGCYEGDNGIWYTQVLIDGFVHVKSTEIEAYSADDRWIGHPLTGKSGGTAVFSIAAANKCIAQQKAFVCMGEIVEELRPTDIMQPNEYIVHVHPYYVGGAQSAPTVEESESAEPTKTKNGGI